MADVVHLDVPLFIRLIELAREDVKQDADLHDIAQKVIELSKDRVVTMADYDQIVSFMKDQGEPAPEQPQEAVDESGDDVDAVLAMVTRLQPKEVDQPAGYQDRDVHRFKQIVDLAGQQTISTEPQEAYADLAAVTVNAGKENMNGAKHPADIRGEHPSLYPGTVHGAR